MLAESRRPDSQWAPYFAVLPRELDSLVFWSDVELQKLQASTVVRKLGKTAAEELFSSHLTPLGFNVDICHRVASTIMAYAFDIPEDSGAKDSHDDKDDGDELQSDDEEDEKTILSMVPMADMLNADADRNNARLFYDNEDLEMRAIKPISKGEEIFNDYGQLPRADLLRRYGYVTDNYAQYDVAELSTQAIIEAFTGDALKTLDPSLEPLNEEQVKQRTEIAEREGIYEDSYDVYHASDDQPCISDELLAFIFILLADKETLGSILSSESSIPSRSKLASELVGKVIALLLHSRAAEYETSIEEDEVLLQNSQVPHREHLAVQVRLGEKKVLQGAIAEASSFQGSNKRMRVAQQTEAVAKRKREDGSANFRGKRQR
jgi:SET domain-containing protein 6